jgi:hypothetical protein
MFRKAQVPFNIEETGLNFTPGKHPPTAENLTKNYKKKTGFPVLYIY